jgi:threonine aldolase
MKNRTFASDNYSGVHPVIMQALTNANAGHSSAYGADEFTARAIEQFKKLFNEDTEVFFVYNGTGANVLGLSAMTKSFNSIICSDLAHINVDESTAPEKFTGCKLLTIPTQNGKIYPEEIERRIERVNDQHHPQPKVISISQSTEYATVYTVEEIKAISLLARKNNLLLHMDGSRIANAAVSLKKDLRAFTLDAGVDVLSFGGTKNGMMFGEAIIFLNNHLAYDFNYVRKQGMQLHSKGRFIGAQFEALLQNDLWRKNAEHSNRMAKLLADGLRNIQQITISQPVNANGVFALMPAAIIPALQNEYLFYIWNERTMEVRLMCAFDTLEEDVKKFIEKTRMLLQ